MDEIFNPLNENADFEDEDTLEFGLGERDPDAEETTWEWDGKNWIKVH